MHLEAPAHDFALSSPGYLPVAARAWTSRCGGPGGDPGAGVARRGAQARGWR